MRRSGYIRVEDLRWIEQVSSLLPFASIENEAFGNRGMRSQVKTGCAGLKACGCA